MIQRTYDVYGKDNDMRLVGQFETANIYTFVYSVTDRGASVRIPRFTETKNVILKIDAQLVT